MPGKTIIFILTIAMLVNCTGCATISRNPGDTAGKPLQMKTGEKDMASVAESVFSLALIIGGAVIGANSAYKLALPRLGSLGAGACSVLGGVSGGFAGAFLSLGILVCIGADVIPDSGKPTDAAP